MSIRKEVSFPVLFTQDYDPDTGIYSESFTLGYFEVESSGPVSIESVLIQAHYFQAQNAIRTPVRLLIVPVSGDPLRSLRDKGALIDRRTGEFEALTSQKLDASDVDVLNPVRIAFQAVDEDEYAVKSAAGFIRSLRRKVGAPVMFQGRVYSYSPRTRYEVQDTHFLVIPFQSSLQSTAMLSSGAVNMVIDTGFEV